MSWEDKTLNYQKSKFICLLEKFYVLLMIISMLVACVEQEINHVGEPVIAAGPFHTVVVRQDGSLWAWGYNNQGQLGDGTTENRARAVQIGSDTDWETVSVGLSHTMAIRSDGSLWGWGWNQMGQVGDGTNIDRARPVQIGTDTDWVSVTAGNHSTVAIKNDGSLFTWGRNDRGQLGNGTMLDSHTPTQILTDVIDTWGMVKALRNDNTVWFWGSERNTSLIGGPLGDFSYPDVIHLTPIQVGNYEDWLRTTTRQWTQHHWDFTVNEDGSLWGWGNNTFGQLGDGTTTRRDEPVQIGTDRDWLVVALGDSRTVAIKTDGSVWSWGWSGITADDRFYERTVVSLIGDGGTENRLLPVKIIDSIQYKLDYYKPTPTGATP